MDKFGVFHSDYPDIELPNKNIWQYLYPKLKKWSDLTAFIMCDTEESLTYTEHVEKSLRWAKELKRATSSHPNATVAFAMTNNIDCFPMILGTFAAGVSLCPLREDTNKDLMYLMVTLSKPDILVLEPEGYLKFKDVLAETGISPKIYIRGHVSGESFPDIRKILNSGDMADRDEIGQFDPKTVAMKAFSSGTTGAPKCIVISHQAVTNAMSCLMYPSILTIKPADEAGQETIGGTLPLAHSFGLSYFTIFASYLGCRVAYMNGSEMDILRYSEKYKPSLVRMRSYILEAISYMDCAEALDSLKTVMFTGSPFEGHEAFKRLNYQLNGKLFFQNCYGSSEISAVTMTPVGHFDTNMTGKLLPNHKAKFLDLETRELITEPHKLGELCLKGPGLMDEYLNNPEATKKAIDDEGWFQCGDIGYYDEDSFIKVIDRSSDFITIKNNGKVSKVSPTEIEKIIKQHPAVMDSGVVGIPNYITREEEIPKAFVIRKQPIQDDQLVIDEEELVKFVEERAPAEMRLLGGVVFVKDLPRNNMGKLLRKFLKETAWYKDI